jgi:DNA-binding MarR family transcriptional regulator
MTRSSRAEIVVRLAKVLELTLASLGLTANQYRALTLIKAGAPPLREFSLRLAMRPQNLSTLIDGLVSQELVARRRDPGDGRRVVLSLTTDGRATLARAEARMSRALDHVASFDEGQAPALLAGIDRWQTALDNVAADLHDTMHTRTDRRGNHKRPARRANTA